MYNYEMLFIIDNSLTEEQKEVLVKKVESLIEKSGCKLASTDKWGTKKLAYAINYKTDGYYVLVNFEGPVSAPKVVSDLMNITDGVVRHMLTTK